MPPRGGGASGALARPPPPQPNAGVACTTRTTPFLCTTHQPRNPPNPHHHIPHIPLPRGANTLQPTPSYLMPLRTASTFHPFFRVLLLTFLLQNHPRVTPPALLYANTGIILLRVPSLLPSTLPPGTPHHLLSPLPFRDAPAFVRAPPRWWWGDCAALCGAKPGAPGLIGWGGLAGLAGERAGAEGKHLFKPKPSASPRLVSLAVPQTHNPPPGHPGPPLQCCPASALLSHRKKNTLLLARKPRGVILYVLLVMGCKGGDAL